MIRRIVKLQFKQGSANEFLEDILPHQKKFTRNFKGCEHLELWRSVKDEDRIISFSIWQSEADLNRYRNSEQFRNFWYRTKALFAQKAEVESLEQIEVVNK